MTATRNPGHDILAKLWQEYTPCADLRAAMSDVSISVCRHVTEIGHAARARRSAAAVIAKIEDTANLVDCVTPTLWDSVRRHPIESPDDGRARVLWIVAITWRLVCIIDYKPHLPKETVCALASILTNLKSAAQSIPATIRVEAEDELREVESEQAKNPGPEFTDPGKAQEYVH